KLIIVQPQGGLTDDRRGSPLSFLDLSRLGVLLVEGEAEFQGLSGRRETLQRIAEALDCGVGSVNLCSVRVSSASSSPTRGRGRSSRAVTTAWSSSFRSTTSTRSSGWYGAARARAC